MQYSNIPPVQAHPVQQVLTPGYQWNTTNKSFLEMHRILKAKGIKNNKFMLTLYDMDLANIDPYDPHLPLVMKQKVLREIIRNYWYFLREVVRVPMDGAPTGAKYQLNRGNLAFNFCVMYNLNTFFEMPRQLGKTMAAVVRYLYIYNFASTNSEITFMHKDMNGAKDNLNKVKVVRDLLPPYLQMAQTYSMINGKKMKLPSTVQTMQNPVTRNTIKTVPSVRNAMGASNLLRGRTITLLWADEWAFIKFNDVIYVNGIPALNTAFSNAKRNGAPYGIIITTTAGIMSSDEGIYAHRMIDNATPFSENWYDLNYQELMKLIDANDKSTFVYIKFTYQQLGKSEKWFTDLCRLMEWKMQDIRREVLLEWIDTPENSPFRPEDLDCVRGLVRQPIKTINIFGKYPFNIYQMFENDGNNIPINPPIIGVDVSGGYKRDYSAISVIDSKTTRFMAEMKCNYISQPELARVIYCLVTTMMPNAIVNIEANGGFGGAVIAQLKNTSIAKNLYWETKEKVIEEAFDNYGRPVRRKQKVRSWGLTETKDTRDMMIELLRERMELHKDKFVSPTIYDELSKMVVKRNGKVEHSDTSHDDLVFSYLTALYVWYYGKDLRDRYGFIKTAIRTEDCNEELLGIPEEEKRYTTITEEMISDGDPNTETVKQEVKRQLAEMTKGMGIEFAKFLSEQRAKEDEYFKGMMQNKVARQAYSEYTNSIPEDVERTFSSPGMSKLPDSLFMNTGMTPEEQMRMEYEKNFNLRHINPDR